jgi:hypothetical protein
VGVELLARWGELGYVVHGEVAALLQVVVLYNRRIFGKVESEASSR